MSSIGGSSSSSREVMLVGEVRCIFVIVERKCGEAVLASVPHAKWTYFVGRGAGARTACESVEWVVGGSWMLGPE